MLKHEDLEEVWQAYPKELHSWLLRLTEEFDLTFSLPDEAANVIPCLLPDVEPKVLGVWGINLWTCCLQWIFFNWKLRSRSTRIPLDSFGA